MKVLLKNSLFHFIVIGTIMYLLYTVLIPANTDTILVDRKTIDAIIEADQELTQKSISEDRKNLLIENYIDEEVLLRQAYDRELHKSDFRVRKRLLSIMRSSITEIIPEPSLTLLRAYYDENKQKFKNDESLSFEIVRFSFNSNKIPDDPLNFIQKLENSLNPFQYSETNVYGNKSTNYSYKQIAMNFGKELAEATFKARLDKWTGPVSSNNEIIYFRVIEKHPSFIPEFESIQSYLRDDYYLTKSRELQQSKIDDLRKKYTIIIEGI